MMGTKIDRLNDTLRDSVATYMAANDNFKPNDEPPPAVLGPAQRGWRP